MELMEVAKAGRRLFDNLDALTAQRMGECGDGGDDLVIHRQPVERRQDRHAKVGQAIMPGGGNSRRQAASIPTSGPANTSSASSRSNADLAIGPCAAMSQPALGNDEPGKWPLLGTAPSLGLWPQSPQKAAGMRIDPPRSLPKSSGVKPAASAPEPPELPPGVRVRSHGLLVRP